MKGVKVLMTVPRQCAEGSVPHCVIKPAERLVMSCNAKIGLGKAFKMLS